MRTLLRAQSAIGASTYRGGSPLMLAVVILIALATTAAAVTDCVTVKVTATPIDFGQVFAPGTFTGIGTVAVTAPPGVPYSVSWGRGLHYFAGSRHIKRNGGADQIPYSLYRDAGCTLALGDPGLGDTYTAGSLVADTGNGRDKLITIHARLNVPASAAPGLYLDSIVVSVDY